MVWEYVLPTGISVLGFSIFAVGRDHRISKEIEEHYKPMLENPEKTKRVAFTLKQELRNEPVAGILTYRKKKQISKALDKMLLERENELMYKGYPPLNKLENVEEGIDGPEFRVIPPEI